MSWSDYYIRFEESLIELSIIRTFFGLIYLLKVDNREVVFFLFVLLIVFNFPDILIDDLIVWVSRQIYFLIIKIQKLLHK
jgi:hypothetical protein